MQVKSNILNHRKGDRVLQASKSMGTQRSDPTPPQSSAYSRSKPIKASQEQTTSIQKRTSIDEVTPGPAFRLNSQPDTSPQPASPNFASYASLMQPVATMPKGLVQVVSYTNMPSHYFNMKDQKQNNRPFQSIDHQRLSQSGSQVELPHSSRQSPNVVTMQLSPSTSKIFLTSEDPRVQMMNVRLTTLKSKGQDNQPATTSYLKKPIEEGGYDSGTYSGKGEIKDRPKKQQIKVKLVNIKKNSDILKRRIEMAYQHSRVPVPLQGNRFPNPLSRRQLKTESAKGNLPTEASTIEVQGIPKTLSKGLIKAAAVHKRQRLQPSPPQDPKPQAAMSMSSVRLQRQSDDPNIVIRSYSQETHTEKTHSQKSMTKYQKDFPKLNQSHGSSQSFKELVVNNQLRSSATNLPDKAARLPSTKRLRQKEDEERPRFGKLERPILSQDQDELRVTGNQIQKSTIEIGNNTDREEGEIVVTDMLAEKWLTRGEQSQNSNRDLKDFFQDEDYLIEEQELEEGKVFVQANLPPEQFKSVHPSSLHLKEPNSLQLSAVRTEDKYKIPSLPASSKKSRHLSQRRQVHSQIEVLPGIVYQSGVGEVGKSRQLKGSFVVSPMNQSGFPAHKGKLSQSNTFESPSRPSPVKMATRYEGRNLDLRVKGGILNLQSKKGPSNKTSSVDLGHSNRNESSLQDLPLKAVNISQEFVMKRDSPTCRNELLNITIDQKPELITKETENSKLTPLRNSQRSHASQATITAGESSLPEIEGVSVNKTLSPIKHKFKSLKTKVISPRISQPELKPEKKEERGSPAAKGWNFIKQNITVIKNQQLLQAKCGSVVATANFRHSASLVRNHSISEMAQMMRQQNKGSMASIESVLLDQASPCRVVNQPASPDSPVSPLLESIRHLSSTNLQYQSEVESLPALREASEEKVVPPFQRIQVADIRADIRPDIRPDHRRVSIAPQNSLRASQKGNHSVFDLNAQSFLYQERAKRVFETQLKTQQKFLHTRYNSYFNPARKIKDEINSKFRHVEPQEQRKESQVKTLGKNLDRLVLAPPLKQAGKPFLSPTSVLDKYKNFDVLRDHHQHIDQMIEKAAAQFMKGEVVLKRRNKKAGPFQPAKVVSVKPTVVRKQPLALRGITIKEKRR